MLPDRVSNPGPLTYESGALPIAIRGPAPQEQSDEGLQCLPFDLQFLVHYCVIKPHCTILGQLYNYFRYLKFIIFYGYHACKACVSNCGECSLLD